MDCTKILEELTVRDLLDRSVRLMEINRRILWALVGSSVIALLLALVLPADVKQDLLTVRVGHVGINLALMAISIAVALRVEHLHRKAHRLFSYTEVLSAATRTHAKEMAESYSPNNALLSRLRKK